MKGEEWRLFLSFLSKSDKFSANLPVSKARTNKFYICTDNVRILYMSLNITCTFVFTQNILYTVTKYWVNWWHTVNHFFFILHDPEVEPYLNIKILKFYENWNFLNFLKILSFWTFWNLSKILKFFKIGKYWNFWKILNFKKIFFLLILEFWNFMKFLKFLGNLHSFWRRS